MGSVSRTAQFTKVAKILKKHFKPAADPPERPVLEHLLFACCLEDAQYGAADEAYAAVVHTFFDWNEVRVTSIAELGETMARLPDPRAAANRLKRVLQSIFEAAYAFDLEEYRKQNLGPTVKWLHKLDGTTHFTVSYVVQAALGGHSIPIDSGTMAALRLLDLVTEKDAKAGMVPGLERAVAKSKGISFGSMLHQFGSDFSANPYSPAIRKVLLEINPEVKDRLPKRRTGKTAKPAPLEDPPKKQPAKGKKKKEDVGEEKKPTAGQTKAKATKKKTPSKEKPAKEKPAASEKPKTKATSRKLSKKKPR